MSEQRLRGVVALVGGERQPTGGSHVVGREARGAVHIHAREIVLRVGIAEIRRRVLEHLQRPLRIGLDFAVRNAVEAIDADRDEGVRDRRDVGSVGIVFVVAFDETLEIIVSLDVVARHAVAARIHSAEFPLRERLAAVGGVGQRLDRGLRVARRQIVDRGLQRLLHAGEGLHRDLAGIAGLAAVEREGRDGRCAGDAERQRKSPHGSRRNEVTFHAAHSNFGEKRRAHPNPDLARSPGAAAPEATSPLGLMPHSINYASK